MIRKVSLDSDLNSVQVCFDPPTLSVLDELPLKVQIVTERLLLNPVQSDDAELMHLCFFGHSPTLQTYHGRGTEGFSSTLSWANKCSECLNDNNPYRARYCQKLCLSP